MGVHDGRKNKISEFYRQEFLRHKSRLEIQRTFFAEQTFGEFEFVLDKSIKEMDKISQVDSFEELTSHLLQGIDVVTSLSASKADPCYNIH